MSCACEATSFRDVCLVVLRFLENGHRQEIKKLRTLGDLVSDGERQWHENKLRHYRDAIAMIEKAPQR
ncbi:MAG: hypothetical protein ACTS10_21860 [Kiloniellales bacterium]